MFRDQLVSCPRCKSGLDVRGTRLSCGACHGQFVPETELLNQISSAQAHALLEPRSIWSGRGEFAEDQPFVTFVHELGAPVEAAGDPLTCPRCTVAMTKHTLFAVIVDRCLAHGIWLHEEHELRDILAAATHGI